MAIGAQLGRPGKQVISLLGDGGLGISGLDIETAARYNLPICYIVYNNSGWMNPSTQSLIMPSVKDSWCMLPNVRYDKMFAEVGCHTEYVTEPQEIKPALDRSFKSGKTSVLNIVPDNMVRPPQQQGRLDYYRKFIAER
jgi:acetolactate synthase-1/2/3 large subunit